MRRQGGFTIVELLIVIVVIALLAAITVVAFNGVQQRARASAASSSLATSKKKIELYKAENGTYPLTGNLAAAGVSDGDTTFQYTSNGTTFCITGTNGSISYMATETTGPTSGGCAGHGQGGVAAVTNLATNPGSELNNGWSSNNGSIYPRTQTSAVKRSGTYSTEAHNLGTSTALLSLYGAGANSGNGFPAEPGKTYTASVYVRADVAHQARLSISYRANAAYTAATYSSWTTGTAGDWTRLTYTTTSPAGTDLVRVGVFVDALAAQPANTSGWADDLMFVEGASVPAYADGTSQDWVWNGTPHSASSTGPAR